jgi:flagellar biosynthesis/type III secretory pathway chaperone
MKLDSKIVKQLERKLEQELALYNEYLSILAQEQNFVVSLKADKVASLSQRRGEIIEQLEALRDNRTSMIDEIAGREGVKLSEFIEESCIPADRKKLLALVGKIKAALQEVENSSREFNQILNFSLGLVNGEISLLWSASQSVSRVYNSFGAVHEAVQPGAPRAGSLLGEA